MCVRVCVCVCAHCCPRKVEIQPYTVHDNGSAQSKTLRILKPPDLKGFPAGSARESMTDESSAPVRAIVCHATHPVTDDAEVVRNAKRLKTHVDALVTMIGTNSNVSVPAIIPVSHRGLAALTAPQIRAIMIQKNLSCNANKRTNLIRLLEHIRKGANNGVQVDCNQLPAEENNPFLEGCAQEPQRDKSPLRVHVLCPQTVRASVHGGLGFSGIIDIK